MRAAGEGVWSWSVVLVRCDQRRCSMMMDTMESRLQCRYVTVRKVCISMKIIGSQSLVLASRCHTSSPLCLATISPFQLLL